MVGCWIVATTRIYKWNFSCAASSTGTWVNQLVTLVQQRRWCRTTTPTWSDLGHFLLRELLCHREEVLSVPRIESVVFHLDFWVSSSVVFCLGCVGVCQITFSMLGLSSTKTYSVSQQKSCHKRDSRYLSNLFFKESELPAWLDEPAS